MKSLVYHEYFYKPLPMYIWLTHTTAIRDLQAADNRGPAASKHTRVVKCAQLRTDLQHLRKLAVLMCILGSDWHLIRSFQSL